MKVLSWLAMAAATLLFGTAGRAQDAPQLAEKGVSQIIVQRTECYGPCPIDRLTLNADGTALYEGEQSTERIGRYTGTFWSGEFKRLAAILEQDGFFELKPEVGRPNPDTPDHIVSVVRDKVMTTVANQSAGTDSALWRMETLIRGVAADVRWHKDEDSSESGIKGIARRPLTPKEVVFYRALPTPITSLPIAFAEVNIYSVDDYEHPLRCVTDKSGAFKARLAPGKYMVAVRSSIGAVGTPLWAAEAQTLTVEPQKFTPVTVTFTFTDKP